jgi:hypothetical protein
MATEIDVDLSNKTTTDNTNKNSETIEVKPLSQTSNQTIEVKPLSQTSNQTMDLKPVKVDSNSRQELAYDPIRTDANSTLDLKPIALDVCMRSGPASLPPTHICGPYQHRLALTLLGIEVFGVAWSGETQTIVDDRPRRPVVAWGPVTPAPQPYRFGLPVHQPSHGHYADEDGLHIWPKRAHHRDEGGLRIRLKGEGEEAR